MDYNPWDSPGQSTGVGNLSLLQGVFPTQGSNPGLPHCKQILYQLSHQGSRKSFCTWKQTKRRLTRRWPRTEWRRGLSPAVAVGERRIDSKFIQFSSVAKSSPTLCDPMNRSTPGLPVHHQLPEFTQTHVHWVGDAIRPSHPLKFSKLSVLCQIQIMRPRSFSCHYCVLKVFSGA